MKIKFRLIYKFFLKTADINLTSQNKGAIMQVNTNTYSSIANSKQVSNTKADENTKDSDVQSANSQQKASQLSQTERDTIEKLSSLGGKGLTQLYFLEFSQQTMSVAFGSSNAQNGIADLLNGFNTEKASSILSQIDFAALGYTGKNPLDMNTNELNELLSENGFFGVDNTANRIADFVIQGAGDDLEKLQKGFEGMKRGFEEAERMWGGKLPQISQDTIAQAIEKVSKRVEELGGNAVDFQA